MVQEQMPQDLVLKDRQKLTVTAVTEVISFDETAVVLQTSLGLLTVQGQGLQLKALSVEGGQTCVEGSIRGLFYEETRQGGGWLRRFLG